MQIRPYFRKNLLKAGKVIHIYSSGISAASDRPKICLSLWIILYSILKNFSMFFCQFPFPFNAMAERLRIRTLYSRGQRAKWACLHAHLATAASNTLLLCSAVSLTPRCLQRGCWLNPPMAIILRICNYFILQKIPRSSTIGFAVFCKGLFCIFSIGKSEVNIDYQLISKELWRKKFLYLT